MATTTVGRLLLKEYTPKHLHHLIDNEVLDKKGITTLFSKLVELEPTSYSKIVSDLTRLGFEVATRQGTSITLKDLVSPIDKDKIYEKFEEFKTRVEESDDAENVKQQRVFDKYNNMMEEINKSILDEGLKSNKSLAKIILAGSRGSPSQYRFTIATQGVVVDADGNPKMDIPVKSSYAEGLSLPEYLVTSFGTRTGEVVKKVGVAQGGYSSKQFSRALMNLQVTQADCGTPTGITVPVEDKDSVGAFLAAPAGSYNRNNEVTAKMLSDLRNKGVKSILVRSPMTCRAGKNGHFGSVCQLCVGVREKGLAAPDTYIGLVAATAVSEPLTEYAMKLRHGGGAATSLGGTGGFKTIDQLANIPKTFLNKSPLAKQDGVVTAVRPAAAGGYFITVGDEEYYIGVGLEPKVAVGDQVEEGDSLSTGLIDPREVVMHKGIGEGRKYYASAMKRAFDDGNLHVNRRNFELIARSAIDHVKITDPEGLGNFLPDEIVSYTAMEKNYKPRSGSKDVRSDLARGKYLEQPVLHYTIGTRVTSQVIKNLKEGGIESVNVHDSHPNFEPVMVRLLDVPEHTDDFMHILYSTNLAKRFNNAVNAGASSDVRGPSPIPGLAYGVGFGETSNFKN
jgi:DNA-directed RNA polymerase subunit beta'